MTEKRFKFIRDSVARNLKTPICDNGQSLNLGEVLDKMNTLTEENEQLKQKLKEHKTTLKGQSNSIYQLKKENELLKRRLEEWV